ncbi:metalloregulator ArsR/SmtB family transcription factor [Sphingomonas sp. ASV193]|uniref:ArsR/SmtB family transcription factor n=1 Tax=Sphingomonas sp. ASV193 TaxID=3144405 RepID=UPI0032E85F1F
MSLSRPTQPLAARFQALADPTRLRVLSLLRAMELAVGEIAQVLGQSQPNISHHVKVLDDAGLIERRKEGSFVYLGLSPQSRPLFELTAAWADDDSVAQFDADAARLEVVRAERAEAARRYFEAHAATWESVRALHVAECEIEQAIGAALGDGPLGVLLDIGTGTGRMLELFAARAERAIGVDRSSEMLRLARVRLDDAGVAGASLRQGDMFALPLGEDSVDSIILHHVLHFAQSPGAAIGEAARVLRDGGQLVVVDFAQHDRAELRERDAHLRLGFADEAMRGWFDGAGLALDRIDRLEGGELTVILWRGVKQGGVRRGHAVAGRRAA